ncbi:hypothetical protein PCASD_07819 [Puccinia coronata f. sp. avenae]|uniref:Uncharacterized protein n=1 Tax=Puccinia coronata f. sp. avenae TaxID=200324 RepID=A0A2N5UQW0_9BASI|nr:hypothetical protein PCASD_07819 [Puccinia coronata f. sp. avenae]
MSHGAYTPSSIILAVLPGVPPSPEVLFGKDEPTEHASAAPCWNEAQTPNPKRLKGLDPGPKQHQKKVQQRQQEQTTPQDTPQKQGNLVQENNSAEQQRNYQQSRPLSSYL